MPKNDDTIGQSDERLRVGLAAQALPSVSLDFDDKIMTALAQSHAYRLRPVWMFSRDVMGAALAAAAAMVCILMVSQHAPSPSVRPSDAQSAQFRNRILRLDPSSRYARLLKECDDLAKANSAGTNAVPHRHHANTWDTHEQGHNNV